MEAHPKAWQLPHALGVLLAMQSDDTAKAIVLFEQATHLAPRQAQVWLSLAQAYEANHQEQQALQAYREALTCEAPPIEAFTELARFLEERNLLDEAASALESAILAQPALPELGVLLHIHRFYVRHDAHENALNTLETALKHFPEEGMLHFLKGVAHDALERPAEAEASYATALELSGDNPELHLQMAQYFTGQGDEMKAIQHLVAVLEHQPAHIEALEGLAQLLMRQALLEQALQVQQRLTAQQPELARAWLLQGELHARLNQPTQAIEAFNQALTHGANRGLELRKCLVASLFPPETSDAQAFQEGQLFASLKSLSLNPPLIENPALDVGITPRDLHALGLWNHRLQSIWEAALAKVEYLPYTAKALKEPGHLKRIMVISRGISAQNEVATLWLPGLNALNRNTCAVTWLNLSSQGNTQATLPAGVALPEGEQVIQLPSYQWHEIQHAVLDAQPDVLVFSDAEGDCVSQALRLWPKAPPSVDFATLQLPLAMLPPIGSNTKRFKQDFGAPFDYPLFVIPMGSHELNATNLQMIHAVLEEFPQSQCVISTTEAPPIQAMMQQRLEAFLQAQKLEPSRIALMRLASPDRLRLLQVADAILMPHMHYVGLSLSYLSMVQALHFGTPVYALNIAGGEKSLLPFKHHETCEAPLWNTPDTVEELLESLRLYLNDSPEGREAMRPQRQAMCSAIVLPRAFQAQAEALLQAIEAKIPVNV
jgi:tetratricopeptide (TPR) repeat protein